MNSGDGSKQSDLKQALRGRELPIVKLCVYRFLSIRSLELQILSFIEEPRYPNLIDKRTDISQKDEKPSKKRQNRTRDGKVCEDEAQSKSSQLREEKAKKNIT
ncbi:hypothetical protein Tco_0633556 [Tanacetum coccineum]